MHRREVIALGIATFAGCTAAPEPPDGPLSAPNVYVGHRWTGSVHRLTFEYGTTLTERNTETLYVLGEDSREEFVWVSRSGPAASSFPLEPGDSITVGTDRESPLRIVWTAPDGPLSATLDSVNRRPKQGDSP